MKHFVKGVRPWHVVAVVYVANVVGTALLFVEYLLVLPLPEEAQVASVTRDNVVLGIVCTRGQLGSSSPGTRRHARIARSTGPCAAPIPPPRSSS